MKWFEIKMDGVARIDRVAGMFEVWVGGRLPFAKIKVKIIERAGTDFLGVPNIANRNPVSGEPEWISGLGDSIEEALKDALDCFFREIEQHAPLRPLTEEDFVWSDPNDF